MTDFDLVLGGTPRFAAEAAWARRLIERHARSIPARTRTAAWGRRPTIADARGESPYVLVEADPEAYLVAAAAHRLLDRLAAGGCDAVLPVSNEPWCDQGRGAPAFAYHTPSDLEEAAAVLAREARPIFRASSPRSPAFAVRRQVLQKLDRDFPLDQVPEEIARRGSCVLIDPGAYLHRYGEMDSQSRADLVAKIPAGARSVLDVGCSRGATSDPLKNAGVVRIVGIEPNCADAALARRHYDRVIELPLEEVREEFVGEFDAIFFGDVLEHLADPSAGLARVRPWLSGIGRVIASVPNVGHWSVIADLLAGRFDYIPYSILSGTHVRFFTRRTVEDLFEACGYRIEEVEPVRFTPSPEGEKKRARLAALPGASDDLDVAEFLIVGRPAAGS